MAGTSRPATRRAAARCWSRLGARRTGSRSPGRPTWTRRGPRGTVAKVMVGEGDEVEEGQPLLVLEAMKMEQTVAAPYSGTVTSLPFAEGALVPGGSVLAEVSEQQEAEE